MEIIKHVAKNDKGWERWKEEAENMRKLAHEHILKLLHTTYDLYPELELAYIQGGPLSKLKNVTVPESVLVLAQCLSALAYLHERQLAHCDLSPNNILIRKQDPFQVVLTDVRLSKNTAELQT
ncbi:uncharacterized protein UV8b_03371 [Ustilaginoidea virens]|uniref:non-specific serine/threonine protein kinase n=1 Tax=Ustilaginoidea virens TaxID=1159556 RepID=A0A8E5HP87_USTVR|nr:uncharacterized protein UV8b_03371 [Ustilaginoidea virens]QUC19130.1 hypothetical protein UV8b_03371 [Ustilaginoidea virens]